MTEYKNLPEKYPLFNNKSKRILPLILISVIIIAYGCYNTTLNGEYNYKHSLVLFSIFMAVLWFGYIKGRKRRKQLFDSYRLIIESEVLTRKQSNFSDISIPLNEITRIDEMNGDILVVRGQQKDDSIVIWPYIENYDEMRALLETYRHTTPIVYKNIFQKYPAVFGMLIIAAMLLVSASNNKIVIGISSIVLLSCVGWTFYKARTSKQIDAGTKKWAWVTLVFFFFAALVAYKRLVS